MRAIVYRGAGGVEVMAIEERENPVPGPDQVLVAVVSTGRT